MENHIKYIFWMISLPKRFYLDNLPLKIASKSCLVKVGLGMYTHKPAIKYMTWKQNLKVFPNVRDALCIHLSQAPGWKQKAKFSVCNISPELCLYSNSGFENIFVLSEGFCVIWIPRLGKGTQCLGPTRSDLIQSL